MYEDNQAVQETCTIVKNMPNDNGELYIQVFNSKGNMIAIDMNEFKRQIEQQEHNVRFYVEERDKGIKELEEQRREFNRVKQKWDQDFTKLKETNHDLVKLGNNLVGETLKNFHVLLQLSKIYLKDSRVKRRFKDEFERAEKFYNELNSVTGRFANFYTHWVGPQQVTNTDQTKR
jgi:predicted  nucleic acid-binding Zn-ribbon protein